MSEQDPIRIFVTHEFVDNDDYARVFEYLESRDSFFYINRSTPDQRPDGGQDALEESLRNQIKGAEVVIYPVGSVPDNSALLRFQLTVAQAFGLPILVIQSFGGTVAISKQIMDIAADMVEWNDRVIIDATRRLARGEDSQAWDVIEFDPD